MDGRYASRCVELRRNFSESGLIKARVSVESAWLQALAGERHIRELAGLEAADLEAAARFASDFSDADAEQVLAIECERFHDV